MARIALAALALTVATRAAHGIEAGERTELRGLIERQIEAFRRDDGAAAFGFASPALKTLFGSPERFMEMVRGGYRPVYRPRSYAFGPDRDGPDGPELALRIQDESGTDWDAVYSFEKGSDGAWSISGCRLVRAPGESA
ncbi:MAG: DUF4864 domain-containing protein [Methylobacteriaceae bacterium]|nr:DUF4864 domain-containing protein [Methylobacteriaceae bacterium]